MKPMTTICESCTHREVALRTASPGFHPAPRAECYGFSNTLALCTDVSPRFGWAQPYGPDRGWEAWVKVPERGSMRLLADVWPLPQWTAKVEWPSADEFPSILTRHRGGLHPPRGLEVERVCATADEAKEVAEEIAATWLRRAAMPWLDEPEPKRPPYCAKTASADAVVLLLGRVARRD